MTHFRHKRATHFGNISTLKKVHGAKRFNTSPIILLTKIFIVTLLFLVATDSIEIRQLKAASSTDYMILLDSSSSMSQNDFNPDRLTVAKDISKKWLNNVPDVTSIGLISFSSNIIDVINPTRNKDKIKEEINKIEIDYSKSGTSLIYALSSAIDVLNKSFNTNKAIILLTDDTEEIDKATIALIKTHGIQIFAFGIGTEENGIPENIPIEFLDYYNKIEFNFTKLSNFAEETGGKAFLVKDSNMLNSAFKDVSFRDVEVELNGSYYIVILITLLSIIELIVYSKFGGL